MKKTKVITEIPFGLSGRIFRSPMPFSPYDPGKQAFPEMMQNNISIVIILTEEPEYKEQTGEDLIAFYKEEGMKVIHLPIADFNVPHREELEIVLDQTLDYALNGKNIAVHCLAGIGRTGLFMASLAKRVFGYSGKEAILWVRKYIPEAVANAPQIRFILEDH